MALLQLRNATKVYPEEEIFRNISLQIQKDDKIGLIGKNGTGKSTLIKIFSDREYLDDGEILTSNDLEIGYLAQNADLEVNITLYQEMLSVYQGLFKLEERIKELESKMSQVNGNDLDKIMKKYSRLRQEYEERNGYQYESQIKGVLRGLGFTENDFEEKIINFSGGQKTRVALAKLLLQKPNLLLLDEPTNHLDLQAKEWLEDYLNSYPGAIIVISHDRYFLDEVVDRIWELEKGRLEKYAGNYSFYLEEKPRKLLTWKREYEKQQKKIKKMKDYIRKNKAGVDAKQARGRQKQLNRMEIIPPPPSLHIPKIEFNLETTSGEDVLKVEGLTKSYDDEVIFSDINFRLYRREKVALVGPNGTGKSTLFKLLIDKEESDCGEIGFGAKVKVGYYDQEQDELTLGYNLIQEMQKIKDVTKSQARDVLARFLFKGDDVFKKISTLSGGEKARLVLAKLSLQDYNLLLLDEPTNHLDIKSKEILEKALQEYQGTILVISHDRYFLDRLINKVYAFQDDTLVEYIGSYSDYRQEYKENIEAKKETVMKKTNEKKDKQDEKNQRLDIEELEVEIIELEDKVEELELKFNNQELYNDEEELAKLSQEYEETKEKLKKYYNLWEESV
ncbi:ABC-F family ATP-binding cassette domain-containing protein [Selenihalanaerobacter shriftii]|uniref:ATP-binding cassette, subfamily F, member 3 n=1 Tax=Selenihalanaerobacter shriftii TaxID=142842 RepID=A0A1T4JK24_9FIRM|nr:ABC-F family ATP-binding cassette domain-containing protein [Selenihalanaerobacter shriftii]SJZ30504.1 ATP-binding cassette, subfamily F, member 3 [Selenihalanaerobacter shriftii]